MWVLLPVKFGAGEGEGREIWKIVRTSGKTLATPLAWQFKSFVLFLTSCLTTATWYNGLIFVFPVYVLRCSEYEKNF